MKPKEENADLMTPDPSASASPELKDVLVAGELERAKRRALAIFDEWQRVTGCLEGSSYQWEVEGIIADAVEIGVQAAYGVHRPLESEGGESFLVDRVRGSRREQQDEEDDQSRVDSLK